MSFVAELIGTNTFSWTWTVPGIRWRKAGPPNKSFRDPLKCNNLPLCSRPPVREKSSKQLQLSTSKNNYSLFSRLYYLTGTQWWPWWVFQAWKPGLSTSNFTYGCLRDKIRLVELLQYIMPVSGTVQVTCTILDGNTIDKRVLFRPKTFTTKNSS